MYAFLAPSAAWPGRPITAIIGLRSRALFADRRIKRLDSQLHLSRDPGTVPCATSFEKAHERAIQINEEVSWGLGGHVHRDSVNAFIHDIC